MMTTPAPSNTRTRNRPRAAPRSGWLVITGLLLLSAVPVLGGVLRLGETDGNGMLDYSPVPRIAHVVGMSVFCLLGAFQFSPALRMRRTWHRTAGRVLIPAGFLGGLSGVWFGATFSGPTPEFAIAIVRLVLAAAMTGFLVLGVIAIRRRDFVSHGAWLTRAYAIAVTGGTQALVFILSSVITGDEVSPASEPLLVAAGFVINIAVAELIIVRRAAASRALVS